MARVKKESGRMVVVELAKAGDPDPLPLEKHPVDDAWICAICSGPLYLTPAGQCCVEHGGGPPTKPASQHPINALSRSLATELEKADREDAVQRARSKIGFDDGPNAAREKPIDSRYPKLVERTFAPNDWDKVFDRFEAWLALGEKRTEEAFIRRAHEVGPDILRAVFGAYVQIQQARKEWELRNDVVLGSMREQATDLLQAEKNKGLRNKTITEADIEKKCAVMFPDEWVAQELRRSQYSLVEARAKHDVEVAGTRCRHLDTMLKALRAT